jgi:hypothetical protein
VLGEVDAIVEVGVLIGVAGVLGVVDPLAGPESLVAGEGETIDGVVAVEEAVVVVVALDEGPDDELL